jgi:hypothetical protein
MRFASYILIVQLDVESHHQSLLFVESARIN